MSFWFFTGADGRRALLAVAAQPGPADYHHQAQRWLEAYTAFLTARAARPIGYPWPAEWPDTDGAAVWYRAAPVHVGPEVIPVTPPGESLWPALRAALIAFGQCPGDGSAALFGGLLAPPALADPIERDHRLLAGFLALSVTETEAAREALFAAAARHRDPGVRAMALSVAHLHYPSPAALRYLCAATHDTDDVVFVRAFRIAGRLRIEPALLDLMHIVSPALLLRQNVVHDQDALVVGLAAANALAACCAIFGTGDPAVLAEREHAFRARSYGPLFARHIELRQEFARQPATAYPPAEHPPLPDLANMVCIPAGPFLSGADPQQIPFHRFDSATYTPLRIAFTETFYIDRYPVTNAEYDEFVRAVEGSPEAACYQHPDQPPGKAHRRNTWDDPRFGPDHPVTGIDWYDAYAYARWKGKTLPTEHEWEKACRGVDGRVFPWGDSWDPSRLHSADAVFGRAFERILDWRTELVRFDRASPGVTTAPMRAHEQDGAGPFGVVDMLGNAWEYTCTSYATGRPMQPRFKHLRPAEFMNAPEAQVIIKGGAWSSIPELTSAAYRGADLLTDRHCEIGVRCVYRPAPPA